MIDENVQITDGDKSEFVEAMAVDDPKAEF